MMAELLLVEGFMGGRRSCTVCKLVHATALVLGGKETGSTVQSDLHDIISLITFGRFCHT